MSEKKDNKNETIFRDKSIERISSPEELNMYIKSTTPSLWVVLGAVIILLVGAIIWSAVGKINAGSDIGCTIRNGEYTCYMNEAIYSKYKNARSKSDDNVPFVKIDSVDSSVANSIEGPYQDEDNSDAYVFHLSDINSHDWYYVISGKIDGVEDGQYKGFIVTEQVSPISFVFN